MKYSKQYLDVTKSEFPCWFIGKNAIWIFFKWRGSHLYSVWYQVRNWLVNFEYFVQEHDMKYSKQSLDSIKIEFLW